MATNATTPEAGFARDLGLFDATMIGVGAMIGAGIFVLTGIAAGEAGPAAILAFALNGLVTLLTAFAYVELAATMPEAGGGYAFVRRAFPGVVGFTAGWLLWFAYTVACSLYALGFAGYFWEFFLKYMPQVAESAFSLLGARGSTALVTVIIGIFFIRLNVRGADVTGLAENVLTLAKLVVLLVFVFYGVSRVLGEPAAAAANFEPFLPRGTGGVLVAMGLTFIAFEGYDLIATVAEEIKEPERNIPRATMIALAVTVTMYLLIVFVALGAVQPESGPSWQFLGRYKETAIVRAAEDFMPAFGVAVIVFGGLFSTLSALNATIMASSRVAFSMGRDRWLPRPMAAIHPGRRTPHVAIVVTGVILLAMALTMPIETVGSAASLIFLLTFAMVNLSLIVLRRKAPQLKRRYRVPLYPATPILGIGLNVFLAVYQFRFQPLAWYLTVGWILVGAFVYFAYSEKQAAPVKPQVLVPTHRPPVPGPEYCLLVTLHNPATTESLLDIAFPIAEAREGRVVAVTVVEIPRQLSVHEGLRFVHHREPLLKQARAHAHRRGQALETDVVVAHHAYAGLLTAAERHGADLLVMGWKGYTDTRERIFGEVADQLIRHAPCDLMLLKTSDRKAFRTCLFPTAGGPHATLAAQLLRVVAPDIGMTVTACYVVRPEGTAEELEAARGRLDQALTQLGEAVTAEKRILTARSVAGGIALASREYDLVVIGAAREPLFRQVLFGEIPERVARYSPTSVLVVKRYEGAVKSILKKALG
jgi:amino acid transporter/nucleotide-binding universal stress UspA family protein